jgi:hypothetical protein
MSGPKVHYCVEPNPELGTQVFEEITHELHFIVQDEGVWNIELGDNVPPNESFDVSIFDGKQGFDLYLNPPSATRNLLPMSKSHCANGQGLERELNCLAGWWRSGETFDISALLD